MQMMIYAVLHLSRRSVTDNHNCAILQYYGSQSYVYRHGITMTMLRFAILHLLIGVVLQYYGSWSYIYRCGIGDVVTVRDPARLQRGKFVVDGDVLAAKMCKGGTIIEIARRRRRTLRPAVYHAAEQVWCCFCKWLNTSAGIKVRDPEYLSGMVLDRVPTVESTR